MTKLTDNDTQYGNLLRLDVKLPKGVPAHHQYIVIDFEYAGPNHRGYDLANHFHEWTADYTHPTLSYSLSSHSPYPTLAERERFYRAYLSIDVTKNGEESITSRKDVADDRIERLEREVRLWSPACSVFWSLWGIIQAEAQMISLAEGVEEIDFDNLAYSMERLEMFRKEATELGAL